MKYLEIIFARLFVNRYFYRFFQYLYVIALKGLGYLNYRDMHVSGELFALSQIGPKTKPLIFDIGAAENQDYVTEIFKKYAKADIYAFEPNPDSFAKLVATHKNSQVHLYRYGLGAKAAKLTLYDYPGHDATQHASLYKENILEVHKQIPQARTISIRTLDSVYKSLQLKRPIDFLKIDTEGSELAVIQGAKHLLDTHKIKLIQFEFNVMNVYSRVFLRDFIELLPNYTLYLLLPSGLIPLTPYNPWMSEIFAFHNILAVSNHLSKHVK